MIGAVTVSICEKTSNRSNDMIPFFTQKTMKCHFEMKNQAKFSFSISTD